MIWQENPYEAKPAYEVCCVEHGPVGQWLKNQTVSKWILGLEGNDGSWADAKIFLSKETLAKMEHGKHYKPDDILPVYRINGQSVHFWLGKKPKSVRFVVEQGY